MAQITASMVKELREMTAAAMMDCKKALTECDGEMEAAKELLRKKGQAIATKKASRETKEGAIAIYSETDKAGLVKMACETDFVAINDQFKSFIGVLAKHISEVGADNFTEKSTDQGTIKEIIIEAVAKLGENIVFIEGIDWKTEGNSVIGSYVHSNGKIGTLVELTADGDADKEKLTIVARDIAMHIAASNVEAIREEDLDPQVVEKEKNFLIDQAKESGKPDNIIEKMVEGRIKKYKKEICLLYQSFVKNPEQTIEDLLLDSGKTLGAKLDVKRYFKTQF
ncbi:MAG: translation elongation factor Ts [Deltaproteobacteria bacterium]|jgi:elongation factor Ts|nr:translation elongation factor Ts [Deltaproteobacteria bacterium]